MLIINKKNNTSRIILNKKHEQSKKSPVLIPKIDNNVQKIHSFQDWYDIYHAEIHLIIDKYIDTIMNRFASSDNVSYSLNIHVFRDKMTHLLYEKSVNKFKSIIYL